MNSGSRSRNPHSVCGLTKVIGLIDLLIKDLDKEMTVAKAEEKDAQGDYENKAAGG